MSKPIGIFSRLVIVTLAAAFVLSWSSGFLAAKIGTVDVAATTLLMWRFLPLGIGLILFTSIRRRTRRLARRLQQPGIREPGALEPSTRAPSTRAPSTREPSRGRRALTTQAIIGFCSQFGYVLPIYLAIGFGISTGTTALIDAIQPIVIATLVGPILGLRVRALQWVGLALGALGVLLIVATDITNTTAPPWAYLLPLCAMASLIFGTFWERKHPVEMSVPDTLTVHVSVAAAAFVIIALLTGTAVPPATWDFWATIAFLAFVPTLSAYGLYWVLMRRIGITALNALLFLVAPTTAVLGALLFDEPLTATTAIGLVLAGLAVALVVVPARTRAAASPAPTRQKEIRTTEG